MLERPTSIRQVISQNFVLQNRNPQDLNYDIKFRFFTLYSKLAATTYNQGSLNEHQSNVASRAQTDGLSETKPSKKHTDNVCSQNGNRCENTLNAANVNHESNVTFHRNRPQIGETNVKNNQKETQ